MTNFYKLNKDGYVVGIGTNGSDEVDPITEEEYNTILSAIRTRPTAPNGYTYMLRDNSLEWELVELVDDQTDPTTDDIVSTLFGGDAE